MEERKLYKYLDVDGGITMLYHKTLMFTHPLGMNDPFDCHPALIDCSKAPKERTKIWGPKLIEDLEINHLEQKRDRAYLCCLSKVYNSIPMWAHYAKHCGICIGINMDKAKVYLDHMYGLIIGCMELEVQYKDIVNKPDYYRDFFDRFRYQFATKAKDWEYEQEVRLLSYGTSPVYEGILNGQKGTNKHPLTLKDTHMFLRIGRECFDSVYVGINTTEKDKEKIIKVARMCNPDIKIYQMTMDPHALRLKEEPIEIPLESKKEPLLYRIKQPLRKLFNLM